MKIEDNLLTFQEMANWFRRLMLSPTFPRTRRTQITKGSFAAAKGNDEAEPAEEETPPKTQAKKRRRATTAPIRPDKCPVCEIPGYQLKDCFYAFKENEPEGFRPNRRTKQLVDDNLKKKEVKD